jgi:hypothetical protein
MGRVPRQYRGLTGLPDYGSALLATWRQAASEVGTFDYVPFTKENIVHHGHQLRRLGITQRLLDVKNIPDIIYTYRARADLPGEILEHGHFAIIGRGKGLYAFVKIPKANRIRIPGRMKERNCKNEIPAWVKPYMSKDEQGMLTTVCANNLVARHLGLKRAYRLQSHLRLGVEQYGQVEVDEVYLGESHKGIHVGIAVEAKDQKENDLLNVSQLFGTSQALRQLFPQIEHRLLGVKPDPQGAICICEFATPEQVSGLREAGEWLRYDLT